MIVQKFWSAFMAQINKIANVFWEADPIAQMQYEYDRAVDELKEGRTGLEQYRGLVERVTRQVSDRQWSDVVGVLRVQRDLDLAFMRDWAARLAVTDLFERALREAAR